MKIEIIFVLALCFISYVSAFSECEETAKVVAVKIDNKPISLSVQTPTVLHKGTNATIEVDFIPSINATLEKTKVHGIIGPASVPFPLADDGCKTMKPGCPLIAGKPYTFTAVIPVLKIYPSLRLIIKWEEQDQTSKDTFCLLIPAQIVS